mmetsp:Transcript_143605/g.357914  ORF Transcript_143605/g.357914 Transcript_143605/m.357914 type:complete len:86 (+) Transcript_143605:61-318(+)
MALAAGQPEIRVANTMAARMATQRRMQQRWCAALRHPCCCSATSQVLRLRIEQKPVYSKRLAARPPPPPPAAALSVSKRLCRRAM